jgi:WD40 repeat protein
MRYFGIFIAGLALVFLFSQLAQLNPAVQTNPAIELEVLSAENAAELQEIARYGNGALSGAIAWSSETEIIAAATSLGIWLYSPSRSEDARFLDLDTRVFDLLFLNDGQYLAYTTANDTKVIELATGLEAMSFPEFHVISAHPNEDYLLVNKNNIIDEEYGRFNRPDVELWNVTTGELLETFVLPSDYAYFQGLSIRDVEGSQDGRFVAASYSTGIEDTCGHRSSFVLIWDSTKPQEEPFVLSGAEYAKFSLDSHFLVSKEFDSWFGDVPTLRVLNLITHEEQLLNTMPDWADSWGISVSWFGFEPISGKLMTVSEGLLRYWTLPEMEMSHEIDLGHYVGTILPLEDGRVLHTGTDGIHLGDNQFQDEQIFPFQSQFIFAEFLDSGNGFSLLDEDTRLHLWHIDEDLELSEFFVSHPLSDSMNLFALSPDGTYLADATDGKVRLSSTLDNRVLSEIENTTFPLNFSMDGSKLLLQRVERLDDNNSLSYFQVWDIPSNMLLREFGPYERTSQHTGQSSAQLSADGTRIGIRYEDSYRSGQYTVFSIATGEEIYSYALEEAYGTWTTDLSGLLMNGGDFYYGLSSFVEPLVPDSQTEAISYPYAGHFTEMSQATKLAAYITSSHTGCGGDYRQLYIHHLPDMEIMWTRGLPMAGWDTVDGIFNPAGDLVFTVDSMVDASIGDTLFQLPYGSYPSAVFSADGRFFLTNQEGVIRIWAVPAENNGE